MDLLAIYLEDHLALSLGGVRLAKRCLQENRGTPLATFLQGFLRDIEEDRETLKKVARALGGARSALKEAAVVIGEYAGRLKLNGRLLSYSELSRVWELEGLMAGTESRRGLFKVLRKAQQHDERLGGFNFAFHEERADRHREELEGWRVRAAEEAFGKRKRRAPRAKAAPAPAR